MKRILILSANPKNTDKLRLDEEVREIQTALDHSRTRDQFEIVTRWAVRVDDLQAILLDQHPQVVHFSEHGAGSQSAVLENEAGQAQLVSTEALAGLFQSLPGLTTAGYQWAYEMTHVGDFVVAVRAVPSLASSHESTQPAIGASRNETFKI